MPHKNLLLIFTRNPEFGKCKTRLAHTIGKQNALDIYIFLLNHTVSITKDVPAVKQVYYSEEIWENDIWENSLFQKKLQNGVDLGERMANAFKDGFANNFEKIIVIGSDMYDLAKCDIEKAFESLEYNDFVIGPAVDGGYYLLGMKKLEASIFENKDWGTSTVLKDTLKNIENYKVGYLESKNDVDVYDDIKDISAFKPFLQNFN